MLLFFVAYSNNFFYSVFYFFFKSFLQIILINIFGFSNHNNLAMLKQVFNTQPWNHSNERLKA